MKKLKLSLGLLLLTSILAIVACGDDGEESSILGTWLLIQSSRIQCSNTDLNFNQNCTVDCDEVTFTKTDVLINGDAIFTYSINGNSITMERIGDDEVTIATFVLTENALVITTEGDAGEGCVSSRAHKRK